MHSAAIKQRDIDACSIWLECGFIQIFYLCCTFAQLFYPLLKKNIEICNYCCLNYFSIQYFHILPCVFRGSVIRYLYVYNCCTFSDCNLYKMFLFIFNNSAFFCLIWQRKVEYLYFFMVSTCTAYFSSSFAIKFFVLFDQYETPIIASCVFSVSQSTF